MTAGPAQKTKLSWRRKLLFASAAFCAGLLLLGLLGEILLRARKGALLDFGDARYHMRTGLNDLRRVPPGHEYHPLVGFAPQPNFSGEMNFGGSLPIFDASIDEFGFRRTRPKPYAAENSQACPAILALGDSYTFGMEEEDSASWPAALERLYEEWQPGRRVLNAGVCGYGIDQAVLRMEDILKNPEMPQVDTAILAVIADDVSRCALGIFGVPKPYFRIGADRELLLKNVPPQHGDLKPSAFQNLLGRSYLADALLRRIAPVWWSSASRLRVHNQEVAVAKALLARFKTSAEEANTRPVLVLLGDFLDNDDTELLNPLREEARHIGLPLLDLAQRQNALYASKPEIREEHQQQFHYSTVGNRWVAGQIAEFLEN